MGAAVIHLKFQTTFESGYANWSALVEAGDELPDIPKQQCHFNLGLVKNQWSIHTVLDWSEDMRTKVGQGTPLWIWPLTTASVSASRSRIEIHHSFCPSQDTRKRNRQGNKMNEVHVFVATIKVRCARG